MKAIRAALVDDDPSFRRYAARFKRQGLHCEPIDPGSGSAHDRGELVKRLLSGKPPYDLILLDYRLGQLLAGGLGAELRETAPTLPIVLVTSEDTSHSVRHNPALRSVFDMVLPKEKLTETSHFADASRTLNSLARGYVAVEKTWEDGSASVDQVAAIAKLCRARQSEEDLLAGCLAGTNLEKSGEVARWIFGELLSFPGPILGERHAAALVGLELASFKRVVVRDWFQEALYAGVFADASVRFWRGRLLKKASVAEKAADRRLVEHLREELSAPRLAAAKCSWCGSSSTDRVCQRCERPTERSHCLIGTSSRRPPWSDPEPYCFSCVANRNLEDSGVYFDAASRPLLRDLQNGSIVPPKRGPR